MFDFLRNLRDEVVAWGSINTRGFNYTVDDNRIPSAAEIEYTENHEYLSAIGFDWKSGVFPSIMSEIKEKNLMGLPVDEISDIVSMPIKDVKTTLQAYSIMNFFKGKGYSAEEAKEIMRVANIFDKDRTKDAKEIAKLADCSEDSVNAVIKLLNEFGNGEKFKPFTMECATPLSGQKPIVQTQTKPTTKTSSKKGAAATA